ncbi:MULTISPECIES: RNA polymerase sigma factor FliA [Halomonadaceae]|jgi:RNA polymerase sigma factor for flagellar operon FliA|uniref:RNA polymerase sigma factor FliA n=2 Tax=Vreelandella titanicae TaxID=664683 RepID=L9U6B7_9GAMM|nr:MULTISPECIES: RNA polymerase sigma factor FliA [Halomonas]NAO98849.1 FliA/WhiG family RNA polymerase sigma factor [Halomonas sp. MG34]QGQ69047.1 RNA polymerase sigma factor FliA [Halomonas sp. PA16-9]UEQ04406.1 RNA polymerase sigma factor FliA [Halomonas profundus]ELY20357.1 RNA polymerase sigma factor, FliA/WhiG [Halomonas titanicae BH1]KIN13112.1 flagellar biosynthesis sigma factor [Halomonas sp. KHS3]|tara:strand:- start:3277 stop:3978 length:702 start_codon:yes stop_codon:yes gene_type:complete
MYTAQGRIKQSELLTQYMPLVRRQALTLQVRLPASIELDDLIQAGMVGLLEALGRFDATQGATFATFASQRIRGAMMDELRTRDWLPRSVRRSARAVDSAVRQLEQQLGRAPEENEIAQHLEMPLSEYQQLLNDTNSGQLLPFEELVADGGEPSNNELANSPFEQLLDGQQRQTLIEAIEALPEREKLLMALYYQEELNLKEVGAVLGVTESRVSQLHSQAVSRLRARLHDSA